MLRLIARLLRIGLLVLGVMLLVWLPLSLFFTILVFSPWPLHATAITSKGAIHLAVTEYLVPVPPAPGNDRVQVKLARSPKQWETQNRRFTLAIALWPQVGRRSGRIVQV